MYYLSDDERKEAERLARSLDIDEEFRGWSYSEGPLRPPYDIKIPLYIIASDMQFRSKEEYESIIRINRTNPRKELVLGMLLHKTIYLVVKEAKEFVYSHEYVSGNELYDYLIDVRKQNIRGMVDSLEGLARVYGNQFLHYLNRLWYFEALQISASIDRVNSHDRYDPDMLIAKAIPFTLEYKADGSKIGLSDKLSIDAFGNLVIFELKTGKIKDYHKLAIAGYALALESILEHPINVGCLVYVSFDQDMVPRIRRYVFPIEESLRRWFIEERDQKMEILALG